MKYGKSSKVCSNHYHALCHDWSGRLKDGDPIKFDRASKYWSYNARVQLTRFIYVMFKIMIFIGDLYKTMTDLYTVHTSSTKPMRNVVIK